MQKSIRIIVLAALIALGIWGWRVFFPGPESVIKSRLTSLAKTLSFDGTDGNISKVYKADQVGGYFTDDVEVTIDVRGYSGSRSIDGKTEIKQALLYAQANLTGLKVQFLDINVTLGPDKKTAVANLTAQADISGEPDFHLMELNLTLKEVEGKWLITRIETVKTLSSIQHRALAALQ
jgi:hypothetical protein